MLLMVDNDVDRCLTLMARNQTIFVIFFFNLFAKSLQLAKRWKGLTPSGKEKYMELERQDRQRFEEESARADEERLKLQEERRNALVVQEGEVSGSRGARQRIQGARRRPDQNA